MTRFPATLDNTIGAFLLGVIISTALYGASCIQACYYYMHQQDRWPLRVLVAILMILDTLHQIFITQSMYNYLVTNFGNLLHLEQVVWGMKADTLLTVFIQNDFKMLSLDTNLWHLL
ncbi:hypothetical protein F5878DRAFT_625847 [Lentinula raphanica]|uniref:Uncharacterized protein n=1 Tax=Lentinula raphanica TaxID=153919 RepID=A0AA38P4I7_9AGAR|nr:hypothetical protein F5878DRAFT_625847 [Lentinula raphanica]